MDPELLQEKFHLEPRICYDPNQKENLVFLSPLVLLEDLELREGGYKDIGAKEVLSRVAKHICESKDSSLFQVPEITHFHMGYGKNSENKKCQMAIDKEEAEVWMGYLNLSRFSRERDPAEEDEQSTSREESLENEPAEEDEGSASAEETLMEIEFTDFPTPRDTQALDIDATQGTDCEDSVDPSDSGLKIPLKGSYMLLFSILLIFFDKKKKKKSGSSTDDEPKIGANKVSDFLLFWILPYLLNYTHTKVREIVKHHKEVNHRDFDKIVSKSTFEIISDAMSSCKVSSELKHAIMAKYKDFYGTDQLRYKYNLLATKPDAPIILVPKCYKVTKMPVALQDIGSRWRELGDVKLLHQFMSKFIKSKEIQEDFLYSLPLLTNRQGVDYAILLPDEKTFNELIGNLEKSSAEYFSRPKIVPKGGRNLITPRFGLVKTTEKHLAVCFSYLQGKDVSVGYSSM